MKKGSISPTLATILLIVIAVVAALFVWYFMKSYYTGDGSGLLNVSGNNTLNGTSMLFVSQISVNVTKISHPTGTTTIDLSGVNVTGDWMGIYDKTNNLTMICENGVPRYTLPGCYLNGTTRYYVAKLNGDSVLELTIFWNGVGLADGVRLNGSTQ